MRLRPARSSHCHCSSAPRGQLSSDRLSLPFHPPPTPAPAPVPVERPHSLAPPPTGYKALLRLLSLWPPRGRLQLLAGLIRDSEPYPKATALLLHRLKEEMITEHAAQGEAAAGAGRGEAAGLGGSPRERPISAGAGGVGAGDACVDPASGGRSPLPVASSAVSCPARAFTPGGVFTPEAVLGPARAVLRSAASSSSPPLESQVDALLGALNVVLFLLVGAAAARPGGPRAGGGAALCGASVAELRADVLARLEARLRREMDAAWAEIGRAERHGVRGPGGGGSVQAQDESARMAFTHLQMTLVALERVLELATDVAAR